MPYSTPKTNWVQTDYVNIVDWERIRLNTIDTRDLLVYKVGVSMTQESMLAANNDTVPNAEDLNAVLRNLHVLWSWFDVNTYLTDYLNWFDDNWAPGTPSPSYLHLNVWEGDIKLMHDFISAYTVVRTPQCGVSGCGQGMTRLNRWRG